MKLPFTNQVGDDVRSLISNPQVDEGFEPRHLGPYGVVPGNRKSAIANHQSRSGIALVITLILLSVTLVMAVAFLAISRRESASVTTTTDSATARLAAESALAAAESQIIANMNSQNGPGTNNPYNYGLLVSTNYINPNGFATGVTNPENVNYDYRSDGQPFTSADLQQNLANLLLSPRAPVYIATNGGTDFRFYLDLNRNGRFDTNGTVTNVDNNLNGLGTTSFLVGDPEWVGVLERPDTAHGPNNKFLSRYAFIAIPVGNTLDVNYIHNQAKSFALNVANDGFFRNEGVGSWEINLAAFLTDLNTNQWDPPTFWNAANDPYSYLQTNNIANKGRGFEDALSILNYRYNGSYGTLTIPSVNAFSALVNAGIDSYSYGNLMTSNELPQVNASFTAQNWVGSDNTNHFFTPSDIFSQISTSFTNSLMSAGNANSTYDRYTFYRMLSELGTDSTPESGLMNVNYDNIDTSVTNYVPWTPLGFFNNAADRMLRVYTTNWFQTSPSNYLVTYYGTNYPFPITIDQFGDVTGLTNCPFTGVTNQVPSFGISGIPVLMNSNFVYSPAVNRVLQLAANIYDATTNSFYPSVFRPIFSTDFAGNVYITGYTNVGPVSTSDADNNAGVFINARDPDTLPANTLNQYVNVYGVPWILGAKKGFPTFNEFSMENVVEIERRLQLNRTNFINSSPNAYSTNQMYTIAASTWAGVECWNSYSNDYPNNVHIAMTDYIQGVLTNSGGLVSNVVVTMLMNTNVNSWHGSAWNPATIAPPDSRSFVVPLYTNVTFLTNSIFVYHLNTFIPCPDNPTNFPDNGIFPLPQFGFNTTNRLRVIMIDDHNTGVGNIIDYVQPNRMDTSLNINTNLADPPSGPSYVWSTNYQTGGATVPLGVINQIAISKNGTPLSGDMPWKDGNKQNEQTSFSAFMSPNNSYSGVTNPLLSVQAPYAPTRYLYQYTTLQANDPLVHYITSDLNFLGTESGLSTISAQKSDSTAPLAILPNIGQPNDRYEPWGTLSYMKNLSGVDTNAFNLAFKDPLMWRSDSWDFPTYKLPTVGWLGRVHRGTPWQTVYLKATNIINYANGSVNGLNTWADWSGDTNGFDAGNSRPTQDHLLFDIFTTAPNDNATRGQLPINVGAVVGGRSLAAWSALFSGMVVLTNVTAVPSQFTQPSNNWMVIDPAGVNGTNSAVGRLAVGISSTRTNTALFPLQAFTHKGDILATPQLTEQSPFLNTNAFFGGNQLAYGISDELYEWLPQQMMSLVRAPSAPRYVIYCYGQALKPAQNGILTGGSYLGMVTNYQVVTESAARAVIRVEGANTPSPHIVVESFNLLPPD